MTDEDAAVHL